MFVVSPVEGGECCRAHYTESESQEAVWCSDYCCFDTQPYCCNDRAKRAGEGNRSSFCRQWFSAPENVYVHTQSQIKERIQFLLLPPTPFKKNSGPNFSTRLVESTKLSSKAKTMLYTLLVWRARSVYKLCRYNGGRYHRSPPPPLHFPDQMAVKKKVQALNCFKNNISGYSVG